MKRLLLVTSIFLVMPACGGASGPHDGGIDAAIEDSGPDQGVIIDGAMPDAKAIEPCTVGWAIGNVTVGGDSFAVIIKYDPVATTWNRQYLSQTESNGNDISAVDENTAWAALGGKDDVSPGAILHTSDGHTWEAQTLPSGVSTPIKGIKAVNRNLVWAVTLDGIIMKTTDGTTWNVVPNSVYPPDKGANRIDAYGDQDVWIAFPHQTSSYDKLHSIVHTSNGGGDWNIEALPQPDGGVTGLGVIVVSALNRDVVWSARAAHATEHYRTVNGGQDWQALTTNLGGAFDTDDICGASSNSFWAVINSGAPTGGWFYFFDAVHSGRTTKFQPQEALDYVYGGITACGEQTAWAVGQKIIGIPDGGYGGTVVNVQQDQTADGGWRVKTSFVKEQLWKISFVGAGR